MLAVTFGGSISMHQYAQQRVNLGKMNVLSLSIKTGCSMPSWINFHWWKSPIFLNTMNWAAGTANDHGRGEIRLSNAFTIYTHLQAAFASLRNFTHGPTHGVLPRFTRRKNQNKTVFLLLRQETSLSLPTASQNFNWQKTLSEWLKQKKMVFFFTNFPRFLQLCGFQ